ncbi:MAG: sigma-54 dependent transcriptional regulator [Nitrospirota bacterium]
MPESLPMRKILIVDDEKRVRLAFSENLKSSGFATLEAADGSEALDIFGKERPDTVLLDYKMPGANGIEVLQELKKLDPDVPVIMVTAHGDIPIAVEAIKLGAYDFITKPPDFERLSLTLRRAIDKYELEKKLKNMHAVVDTSLEWLLGKSPAIKPIIKQISQVARSDFSLIIQGETGTGKSFIARALHNLSKRADRPFIAVDMGSIPETLVESELFGYEKGAFTGAEKKKKGFFELAQGGTLLIDELQNMSAYVQSKLLRAVEEKRIYPLGSTQPVAIDVRIISATNTDIRQAVKDRTFREDLFYRLSEFMITIPPLRERGDDIPFLAQKFFSEAVEELSKQVREIDDGAAALLKQYAWPGNIRELKNVMRRAVLIADDSAVKPEHIEFLIKSAEGAAEAASPSMAATQPAPETDPPPASLQDAEKNAIKRALESTGGNKTKAAAILQIDYKTLLRKIKTYGI